MTDLPKRLPIWPGAPAASKPRVHIHQRRGPDCAIAAAATIAGLSYDEAASAAFSLRQEGLGVMRPDRMIELLVRLTDMPWRIERMIRCRQLRAMVFPHELAVADIMDPWFFGGWHAIVARGRVVYDGSLDHPTSPEDHPRKKWYIRELIARDLA